MVMLVSYSNFVVAENDEVEQKSSRPTIVGEQVVVAAGETAAVTINLVNNPGIIAMKLIVSFDTDILTLTNVIDAGVLGTQYHKPEKQSPYTLSWGMDTATENCTINGTVVTLEFSVAEDVEQGTQTPIEITYDLDNYDICDFNGDKVEFAVENGSVTIGGVLANPIEDFEYELFGDELIITKYNGTAKKVIIDSTYVIDGKEYTAVSIEECAFETNTNITKVTIPETVTSIGDYAFYDCTSLTDVVIYSKNITIGEFALGYYYISRKENGVVDGFTLTGYPGTEVEAYASAEEKITFVSLVASVVFGDANGDGVCDAKDLVRIKRILANLIEMTDTADVNGDGIITVADVECMRKILCKLDTE